MKVVLDANVLFSASLSAQGTAQAPLFVAATNVRCVSSDFAWTEARRNLSAKAPLALATFELIEAVVERVPEAGTAHVETARRAGVVAMDAPVIAAALSMRRGCIRDQRHPSLRPPVR